MSPVDLMGRMMPRDTRKRRIRAGEHKIRRMDLKGFERIVAHGAPLPSLPLAKVSPPHLPTSVPLVESVDTVGIPSGLRVRDSPRAKRAEATGKRTIHVRGETRFDVFARAVAMRPASERRNSIPRGVKPEAGKRERIFPGKCILSLREMARSYRLVSHERTSHRRLGVKF